jgi:uncharacterized protein YkwD
MTWLVEFTGKLIRQIIMLLLAMGIYIIVTLLQARGIVPTPGIQQINNPAEHLTGLMNAQRQISGAPPLRVSPQLSRIASVYVDQYATSGEITIFDAVRVHGDLNANAYYLGGYIHQLPGYVGNMSESRMYQHIVASYPDHIGDAGVRDVGFSVLRGVDGLTYYSLLLAEPLQLTAPLAESAVAGGTSQEAQQEAIVQLLNVARTERGLQPLTVNPYLTATSYNHSLDQARRDRMGHDGSDGSEPFERAARQGYTNFIIGENVLVRNNLHAPGAFDQWWNSPPHLSAMMHPDFREIGIAYARSAQGNYYYTMMLGG